MSAVRVASISATVLAVIALCSMPAEAARPRGPFSWPQLGPWWSNPAPARHSQRHHRRARTKATKPDQAKDAPKGSLQVIISIADQRISVYENDALIARSSVSTGVAGHPTPLGVFSVIGKKRWHRSNLYSAAPMPYMQRITWSGVALHAGVVPGHPASHGCIRLKNDFAIRLWQLTRRGTRVIIAPDETGPVEIANARLFVSRPKPVAGPPEPRAAMADNAVMPAASVPVPAPEAGAQQVSDPPTADTVPTAATSRKVPRISVFVSRKSGRLFVRQGYTPLFDVPVSIRDPEQPLGTHVFTVMAPQNDGEALRWTAVSIPQTSPATPEPPKRRARGKQPVETAPAVWSPDQANAALDRIDIPKDAVERISGLLTPGSSLIVSDHGISRETGKDTDFIVLTQ